MPVDLPPDVMPELRAPRAPLSGGEIAAPYEELAQNLDKAGGVLMKDIAEPLAARAGAQAVTLDAQGNIQVQRAPIFGDAAVAYQRAVQVSAVAQGEGTAKRDDIALRNQFPDSPEKYLAAAEDYRKEKIQQYTAAGGPAVGLAIGRAIDATTTYTYRSLEAQKQHDIRRNFDQSTHAAIESKTQDLIDLVRTGGANQPAARQLAGDIHALTAERVNNPILGEPAAVGDLKIKQLHEQIGAAGAEYRVNQTLRGQSQFQPMIDAAAAKYGLDPTLYARQLHQESGINPYTPDSAAGAIGIAQFMPATAAQYGVNPRDPGSSIEGAARYMRDLERQFGSNQGLALAAYNWGPGNVAQWMATGANPNAMPAETRNYVQSITGQPIEAWTAGRRPSSGEIAGLPTPPGARNGVQDALALTQGFLEDQSLSPTQRIMNYNAGLKAINDYRTDVVRMQNMAQLGQKSRDESFENAIIADRESGKVPVITENQIKTQPDVSAESKMRMLRWIKEQDMPKVPEQISAQRTSELFRRMHLDDGDPMKITSLAQLRENYAPIYGGDRQINRNDESWLETHLKEMETDAGRKLAADRKEFFKRYVGTIDPSLAVPGLALPDAERRLYRAQQDATDREEELKKAGKNPRLLYRAGSPEFFGTDENLRQYQQPLAPSITANGGVTPSPSLWSRMFGGAPQAPAPRVENKAAYDALAPGTRFVGQDGKTYVKPAAKATTNGSGAAPAPAPNDMEM